MKLNGLCCKCGETDQWLIEWQEEGDNGLKLECLECGAVYDLSKSQDIIKRLVISARK
jgi:uncharacterized Zn finger protein